MATPSTVGVSDTALSLECSESEPVPFAPRLADSPRPIHYLNPTLPTPRAGPAGFAEESWPWRTIGGPTPAANSAHPTSTRRSCSRAGWRITATTSGMVFIDLRDRYGFTQLRFGDETPRDVFERAKNAGRESCVVVRGTVAHRGEGNVSPKFKTGELPTGEVEVRVTDFEVLSESPPPPFEISDYSTANEELRLESRWLDLRRPALQKNFIVRHRVAKALRDYFDANGFLELETPFLTKSTPEGRARLPRPQPHAAGQLLRAAAEPATLQATLHDERLRPLRADRPLLPRRGPPRRPPARVHAARPRDELRRSREDVIDMAEGAIAAVFKAVMNHEFPRPLPHMTYHEAMDRYGIDRPDTRFGLELQDISDIAAKTDFAVFKDALAKGGVVRCIVSSDPAEQALTRKVIDGLTEEIRGMGGAGLPVAKVVADGAGAKFETGIAKFLGTA